jgi:hypothetical protein
VRDTDEVQQLVPAGRLRGEIEHAASIAAGPSRRQPPAPPIRLSAILGPGEKAER